METVIRVAIIYFFVMIGLRILGKREFGQMSPLELVTLLLVPELVTQSLNRQDFSITNGLVGVTTLFILSFFTTLATHRSKRLETLVGGEPAVLVAHGQYQSDVMNRERVTPDEIFNEMHNAGLEKLEQVRWAVLESDGQIAIVPEEQPPVVNPPKKRGVGGK